MAMTRIQTRIFRSRALAALGVQLHLETKRNMALVKMPARTLARKFRRDNPEAWASFITRFGYPAGLTEYSTAKPAQKFPYSL